MYRAYNIEYYTAGSRLSGDVLDCLQAVHVRGS